jgi:16S rRNA (adenine1518-N6/adenine1519-N6)-dimethyltransferase
VARAPGGRGRQPPVLKKFGQHFLTDKKILTAIVDALAPAASDTVVEIGPGRGSLTDILVERAGWVIAVEIDRALAAGLRERYRQRSNIEILEDDFLDVEIRAEAGRDYLLIGNVPYYITTPIIFKALEPPMPRRAVFLVQREVAERMAAAAGDEAYGALTVNVAVVARVEQVMTVPAEAFRPPPKVESGVVRLTPLSRPLVPIDSLDSFRTFVQAAFGQRRKQMQRVLRSVRGMSADESKVILQQVGIEGSARPEVVTPEQFANLFEAINRTLPAAG